MENEPPSDPEEWSDAEWIEWLDSVEDAPDGPGAHTGWRARSSTRFLYAGMSAVYQVIYGKIEEPAIVIEAPGEPPEPESLDIRLTPDHPEDSTVTVRPWLLHHDPPQE